MSTNFLNLPIERAFDADMPFEVLTVPDGPCWTYGDCLHGGGFRAGDEFVRFGGGYVHTDCLNKQVGQMSSQDFLLLLATHVAAAPSRHNAGTIRQVINGLRKALGAAQAMRDRAEAEAYARGVCDASVAIAEADE